MNTTAELERSIGAMTRQLDSLAAQVQGIRRAQLNGRCTDAMARRQTAIEGQIAVLRARKAQLQRTLTECRHPAPGIAPQVAAERFDVTAGLAVARQREAAL
ncbi:MAG: hypothetical protein E6Q97_30655 [Desulfurellales bacterium]|nr:MAG: hypothetical protein E6Q97_30655 [Desulfurellales bacterium]